jgi:hypothetical protein
VADAQLVGQIAAAGITALASAGAAFLGSRSANRSTEVEDKRAKEIAETQDKRAKEIAEAADRRIKEIADAEDKRIREIAAAEDKRMKDIATAEDQRVREAAEWDRIHRIVTMAFSTNRTESYVGMVLLQKWKPVWSGRPEQLEFIRDALDALTAAPVQAYGGSQTFETSPSPLSPTPASSAPMASGGTS